LLGLFFLTSLQPTARVASRIVSLELHYSRWRGCAPQIASPSAENSADHRDGQSGERAEADDGEKHGSGDGQDRSAEDRASADGDDVARGREFSHSVSFRESSFVLLA
jgi:hypothetical protein